MVLNAVATTSVSSAAIRDPRAVSTTTQVLAFFFMVCLQSWCHD